MNIIDSFVNRGANWGRLPPSHNIEKNEVLDLKKQGYNKHDMF